ncbi:MAG: tRNA (adenosine(37)-N6)-threonylcarbamoyltransferase complex transferase subunit TsaD [Candidatus Pacebacteria bacterium]|nr:tRNA (adenosine(37)-N6)-threonylcarbamoyltransferase complex transferase subunit TsaD [Candidatus Paceibacterota bacterium]
MIILGIETSCDETALAFIETRRTDGVFEVRILASLVHSQADLHSPYGGVFPTLAKREHEKHLQPLLDQLLTSVPKGVTIEAIAVTEGPGLEPALWTGIVFAEELGKKWNVPIIPVNHMEGHIVGSLLESDKADGTWQKLKELPLPSLAFLISGGHTELVSIEALSKYSIVGATRDDAVGEAFDKVARLLNLPYPGGPEISRLADTARTENIVSTVKLPRPMIHSKNLQFSFSGLKTAVLYAVRNAESTGALDDTFKKGLAREFEDAIEETLSSKLRDALERTSAQSVIIGGGVSANKVLRDAFTDIASEFGIPIFMPSRHISGDNALMIALAGALNGVPSTKLRAHGTKKLGE